MKTKRIFAYIIDYLIITIIATAVFELCFKSNYETFTEVSEQYLESITASGSDGMSVEESNEIYYKINKSEIPLQITTFGLTVFYFGIISYIANGKTLGKKILKIRVVPTEEGKKLNAGLYFLREIILTNSIFNLLLIISTILCGEEQWQTWYTVISNCKLFVTIALIVVLIFREDERSIHDIISKTKVIEEK